MRKYNRNENKMTCRAWEGEIPKCENCGSQSELMSVFTQYGWMELCPICYKEMYICGEQEPGKEEHETAPSNPSRPHTVHRLLSPNIFAVRLPDLRGFKELFKNIKTAVCGKRKGCESHNKDCPVFCIKSKSLCKEREIYIKKEVERE